MKSLTKLMLTACATAAILAPTFANATVTRLTSYNELLSALKNGHRVSAVADNSKCKVTESAGLRASRKAGENSPDTTMIMGLSFNTNFFLMYRDEGDPRNYLITMVANTLGNMGMGPRIRYKRIRVYDDNSVEVYAAFSNFTTGVNIGESTGICGISNGHDQNGVSLFDYDA